MPISAYRHPPWIEMANCEVFANLEGLTNKSGNDSEKKIAAIKQIDNLRGDFMLYSDGAAS
mgnify:CR=1 FL=1